MKNKHFWSLGKHYFQVEYQVRVIIGPADLRFELWFDNQKLSRDEPIRVEWTPAPALPPGSPIDVAIYNRAELPDSHPTQMSGALTGVNGFVGQGVDRSGTAIESRNGEDRKARRGNKYASGLLGRARGGKWPIYG